MRPFQGVNADVRFAVRLLWRERWFALTAIVTLALAMGMSNTVYTVVNAMILRGLPVAHPDRIVMFRDRSPNGFVVAASYRDAADWRERTSSFAEIAVWTSTLFTIGGEGLAPDAIGGSYVSASIFRVIEQPPLLGRDFRPSDEVPGAAAVVMLGYTVWVSRYGGDPAILGRTVRINDRPATVIGVMPPGVRFPLIDDIWVPLSAMPTLDREKRDARAFRACARLREGVSMSQADAELAAMSDRLAREHPETNGSARPGILPFTGTVSFAMYQALFGAVISLLLIACANVSNLLLARSAGRTHEIAVRLALGGSRWRVIRQLLIESTLLAAIAGVCGWLLALAGVKAFAYAVDGINFPYWYRDRWTMDHHVFAFMVLVCVATTIVFGLVPSLQLARRDVQDGLKEESRTTSGGSHVWSNTLLASEVTVALMLLMAAGLMVKSFLAEYRADTAADAAHVITTSLRPRPSTVASDEQRLAFYRRVEERLRSKPGLLAVTFASPPPFTGGPTYDIAFDAHRPLTADRAHRASFVTIDPGYFETLGVTLFAGRTFTPDDGAAGHEAAIVNEQFVTIVFKGRDPIGQRVCAFDPADRAATPLCAPVVGVSPTVRQQFMTDLDPVIYLPLRAKPLQAMLMVRTTDQRAATAIIRAELQATEPDTVLWRFMPLETWMEQSRWGYRVFGTMFSVFAVIALALCAVGIYAVTAYSVVERTREIGIRLALGARTGGILMLFGRRKLVPLSIGLALGLAGAFGVGRLIQGMLVRTSPADPSTLIGLGALVTAVAAAAVLIPALRATRVQPIAALRHE